MKKNNWYLVQSVSKVFVFSSEKAIRKFAKERGFLIKGSNTNRSFYVENSK